MRTQLHSEEGAWGGGLHSKLKSYAYHKLVNITIAGADHCYID